MWPDDLDESLRAQWKLEVIRVELQHVKASEGMKVELQYTKAMCLEKTQELEKALGDLKHLNFAQISDTILGAW